MSQIDPDTVFDGIDGLSSGAFIRSIRQQSISQNKHDDDRWIAVLASSYLDGSALVWYESLDEETQESWRLLRRALIQRWNPEKMAGENQAPAPAAATSVAAAPAAVPAAAPVAAPSSIGKALSTSSDFQTGRIRVHRQDNKDYVGYISRNLDEDGDYIISPDSAIALRVRVDLDSLPHKMELVSNPVGHWLGVRLRHSEAESQLPTHLLRSTLVPLTRNVYGANNDDPNARVLPKVICGFTVTSNTRILITWIRGQGNGCVLFPTYCSDPTLGDHGAIVMINCDHEETVDKNLGEWHLTRTDWFFERM